MQKKILLINLSPFPSLTSAKATCRYKMCFLFVPNIYIFIPNLSFYPLLLPFLSKIGFSDYLRPPAEPIRCLWPYSPAKSSK